MSSFNPDDIFSQICVMQDQQRERAYTCVDYMKYTNELCPADRKLLCDWAFKVILRCDGVNRLTAVKAFSYFDRFLSSSSSVARMALADQILAQLAFVACLVIALKIHSGFNVESDFVSNVICSNDYDAQQINEMELIVLRDLDWRLNGPTPHDFIDSFVEVVPLTNTLHRDFVSDLSKSLAELAVTRYDIALHLPSEIAVASICCALSNLEVTASIDTFAIFRWLHLIVGLSSNHAASKLFSEKMVIVMRDLYADGSSIQSGVEKNSICIQGSPDCLVNNRMR